MNYKQNLSIKEGEAREYIIYLLKDIKCKITNRL